VRFQRFRHSACQRYQGVRRSRHGAYGFISPAAPSLAHSEDEVRDKVKVPLAERWCSQQALPTGKGCNVAGEHRVVNILQRPVPAQQVHQPRLVAALGGVDRCDVVVPGTHQVSFIAPDRATLFIVR
jgi:hypothetical protein